MPLFIATLITRPAGPRKNNSFPLRRHRGRVPPSFDTRAVSVDPSNVHENVARVALYHVPRARAESGGAGGMDPDGERGNALRDEAGGAAAELGVHRAGGGAPCPDRDGPEERLLRPIHPVMRV